MEIENASLILQLHFFIEIFMNNFCMEVYYILTMSAIALDLNLDLKVRIYSFFIHFLALAKIGDESKHVLAKHLLKIN